MDTHESAIKEPFKRLPTCTEIGLEASRKGDFRMARQMFRASISQLSASSDGSSDVQVLIALFTHIADTYLSEGLYDQAISWYEKVIHSSESCLKTNFIQMASVQIKLAEIAALQDELANFARHFEKAQRFYLLAEESDLSILVNALTDLSWALCVQEYLTEMQTVNDLLSQIKHLQDEYDAEKLTA